MKIFKKHQKPSETLQTTFPKQYQPKHTILNAIVERKWTPMGTPRGLLERLGRLLGGSLEALGCLLASLGSLLGPLRLPRAPQDPPRSDFCRFGIPKWRQNRPPIEPKSMQNQFKRYCISKFILGTLFSQETRENPPSGPTDSSKLKAQSSQLQAER